MMRYPFEDDRGTYDEGFRDGQRSFMAEGAKRAAYNANVTDALDKLIRHYDRNNPALATELRRVCCDYQHPSLIWMQEAISG